MPAEPRQIMPLGCPCCYKRQVLCRHHSKLGLFSPTPLTLHSCIAKHHLLLFCLEQSQLTKKKKKEEEIHDNSCCQTKGKQRRSRKRLGTSSAPGMTHLRGWRKTFTLTFQHWEREREREGEKGLKLNGENVLHSWKTWNSAGSGVTGSCWRLYIYIYIYNLWVYQYKI